MAIVSPMCRCQMDASKAPVKGRFFSKHRAKTSRGCEARLVTHVTRSQSQIPVTPVARNDANLCPPAGVPHNVCNVSRCIDSINYLANQPRRLQLVFILLKRHEHARRGSSKSTCFLALGKRTRGSGGARSPHTRRVEVGVSVLFLVFVIIFGKEKVSRGA
jgi:hypothetical protein